MIKKSLVNKEGVKVPSVTTIIDNNYGWNKNVLLNWQYKELKAGRDPKKISQKAKDIGNVCHDYIYAFEKGEESSIDLSILPMESSLIASAALEQYKKIKSENEIEILFNEESFVSELFQYGGRIDQAGNVKKILSLIDTKTSSGIYQDHLIQLSAYVQLLKENNVNVEKYFFLHINKKPLTPDDEIVKLIEVPQNIIDQGFEIFRILLTLNSLRETFKL